MTEDGLTKGWLKFLIATGLEVRFTSILACSVKVTVLQLRN